MHMEGINICKIKRRLLILRMGKVVPSMTYCAETQINDGMRVTHGNLLVLMNVQIFQTNQDSPYTITGVRLALVTSLFLVGGMSCCMRLIIHNFVTKIANYSANFNEL